MKVGKMFLPTSVFFSELYELMNLFSFQEITILRVSSVNSCLVQCGIIEDCVSDPLRDDQCPRLLSHSRPMRDQYPGHVITHDQSEAWKVFEIVKNHRNLYQLTVTSKLFLYRFESFTHM